MSGETNLHLRLPPELWDRIKAAAARDYLPATLYVRRFLALNIDVIDPEGAAGGSANHAPAG